MKVPIIIIGHGELPAALIKSAQMLVGEREDVFSLCLHENDGLENFMHKIGELIGSLKDPASILIFADLQGGTPWNSVLGVNDARVRLVTGINLPMLLEVLCMRDQDANIDQLVQCALDTARSSVKEMKFPL
jgi:mannose/fructose/sorbose-specific phosphotransferase system IIA component